MLWVPCEPGELTYHLTDEAVYVNFEGLRPSMNGEVCETAKQAFVVNRVYIGSSVPYFDFEDDCPLMYLEKGKP